MSRRLVLVILAMLGIAAALLLPSAVDRREPLANTQPTGPAPGPVTTPLPGDGSLSITARPARKAFLAGGDDLDVVFDVKARAGRQAERVPVDLALVLDRSGSMTGRAIAGARDAARRLVGKLTERDRLALVTFSTGAEVRLTATAMDEAGRRDALAIIDTIEADGGTNIGAALEQARRALTGGGQRERAMRRIVLLSDGRANDGLTGPQLAQLARELGASGLRVSALGLGDDFDEDVMTAIADHSGGRFTYLANDDAMATALEHELAQAASTAAGAVRLVFEAGPGVEVREVVGYTADTVSAGRIVVLSDIAEGDARRVVVRLRATAGSEGAVQLVKARLTYEDVNAGRAERGAEAVASATATRRAEEVASSWDAEAAKASFKARWGSALSDAATSYARDDLAGAEGKIDGILAEIRSTAAAIGDATFADDAEAQSGERKRELRAAPPAARAAKVKALKQFGRDNAGL